MTVQAAPWKTGGNVYEQMAGTIFDYWACWTISAVADLSIADHLAEGSLTVAEVAQRTGSATETTLRLLRAAVSVGLVKEESDGRYGSTPLLETLRSDDPKSMRPFVLSQISGWMPWDQVPTGVREGTTRSTQAFDGGIFEFLAENPEKAEQFAAGMTSMTNVWGPAIAKAIDTTGVKCAVDVGGANGTMLQLLQRNNTSLQGIIFDRPNTIKYAQEAIKQNGLGDRTKTVGGSFFESVPEGDLLLLKWILHDWSDDEAIKILQTCRKSLAPGGRIAIIETVVEDSNPVAALMDMAMLMACTGKERSLSEFDALFAAAGLKRTAVLDTGGPQVVIEVGHAEAS